MSYKIQLLKRAITDIDRLRKSGDIKVLKKIDSLISELQEHPKTGTGKPEQLKHSYSGMWSRRINAKHRLIYQVSDEEITVFVISSYGHYEEV